MLPAARTATTHDPPVAVRRWISTTRASGASHGLTQAWATALRGHGIRVNSLCVGATDTPMLRSFLPQEPDQDMIDSWLRPAEVAGVVLDLLRQGPTGQNIGVWPGHPLPRSFEDE